MKNEKKIFYKNKTYYKKFNKNISKTNKIFENIQINYNNINKMQIILHSLFVLNVQKMKITP